MYTRKSLQSYNQSEDFNFCYNPVTGIITCWLIRRKIRVQTPCQTSKRKYLKIYFFGDFFLSADL